MVDAIIGATVEVLFDKILSLATDRVGMILGLNDELKNLKQSVLMIQAILADADNKRTHNPAVQVWLKSLEGVAFDADHVLDELHYATLRRKVEHRNQQLKGNKVCLFFSFSYANIAFRWRMASRVRDITRNLKNIKQEAGEFGLSFRHQIDAALASPGAAATVSRQTNSILPPNVVGRANDESRIVEMLLSSSEEVVPVIPIVGMGGLGKTTLAKAVYNNPQIAGHFGKKKIWVCVSEKFEGLQLFKLILESLTGGNCALSGMDAIVQQIREKLEGERYLLVLDDVWNEEQILWDDFFTTLSGLIPTNGSRCIVTTRLEQVASIVSRHSPYFLGKLSDDDCWSILKEKAIVGGEAPEELNIMKQHILKICDGLPLAASVLGGLLGTKTKEERLSIVEKGLSNLSEGKTSMQKILKLSFDNLPSRSVKKCFAYCSIFAKDTYMEKDQLIQLWMAEGFLQPGLGNQSTMEEIGDQYFKVLLQSSLLEEVEYPSYKMHDLVHDLAESLSKLETITLENCAIHNHYNEVRYLALNSSDPMPGKILRDISTSVRTLFLERGIFSDGLPKLKNLHVLNLSRADLKELPTSIGELIHLRFLILPNSGIDTLPESVCKLYCLQTLRVSRLKDLPKGMSNLISLRHFHYDMDSGHFQMPLGMGRLTCLQTLEFFNVGEEKGCQIEELGPLKDLKGKLTIRNLHLVNGKETAEGAKISGKPNLLKLILEWSRTTKNIESASCDEDVLEGLQPHLNLQELVIDGFMGNQFPQWLVNLSNLVELHFFACQKCTEIPAALGQLPSLQNLTFERLANVKCIGLSFYSVGDDCRGGGGSGSTITSRKLFPALKSLKLEDMKNLVEWIEPEEAVFDALFPKLEKLRIENCFRLVNFPSHLPSLQRLKIYGNDHVSGEQVCRFQSLRYLEIDECPRFELKGLSVANVNLGQLSLLKELRIRRCPSLTSIPSEVLQSNTSLESLWVYDCPELVSFPTLESLQQIPRLSWLRIEKCPKLMTMPKGFGSLTALLNLWMGPFSDDSLINNEFDWSGLISSSTLKSLDLYGMPQGESLPDQLQYLTTLTTLFLREFGEMQVLPDWLGNLASLEWLRLRDCEKLRYLPSEAAMRRLTKLTSLSVYGCPLLKERCSPQSGPDSEWSKISHIPDLHI